LGLARAARPAAHRPARGRARRARQLSGAAQASAFAARAGGARRRICAAMMEANAELLARAQSLFSSRRYPESERIYRQLLQQTHVIDFEYDDWLKGIAECYRAMGRLREAGFVYLYLHHFDR